MGIFETKKINIETLPEYLVAARESFSYTLPHVAKITNISDKFLQYLEQGYYHRLPADVYVYGFLRKLAELYRVDADLLISQYKKERGVHENLNQSNQKYKSYSPPKFAITPKTLSLSLLAAFMFFVLGYLFYQVHAINRPPTIEISSPADGTHVGTSSVVVTGRTDIGSNLTINDQQVQVDSSGNFKQPVSISQGEKVLTFIAKNNFGKTSTRQISIIGDFQQQAPEAPTAAGVPLKLQVQIDPNSTWVTTKIDNGPEQDETFIAGSSKIYTAHNIILLSTGDAGSTHIKLNDKDLGALGRPGEVLRDIPFTIDNVVK